MQPRLQVLHFLACVIHLPKMGDPTFLYLFLHLSFLQQSVTLLLPAQPAFWGIFAPLISQYYTLTFKIPVVKCHHGIQMNRSQYRDTSVNDPALRIGHHLG